MSIVFLLLSFFITASCSPPPQPVSQGTISAYSTSSVQPWMNDLLMCANENSITVNVTDNEPDIYLRIGAPGQLLSPAYQIGEEEIFIVVNRENIAGNLSLKEVQALFTGSGEKPLQVWIYPSELDVQGLFEQVVMQGRSAASSARVAVNPQEMSDMLNSDANAAGILPARWVTGNLREMYSMGKFPVLALLNHEPQIAGNAVVACLQGN